LEKEHILSISYHPKERINESNFQLESFSINCYQYWYQHTAFQSISISIRLNSKMFMRNVFKLDNFQLSLLIGHFNSSLHWMRFGFLLWFRFLHLNMCTNSDFGLSKICQPFWWTVHVLGNLPQISHLDLWPYHRWPPWKFE